MAEMVGSALADAGWPVSKRHRELERKAATAAAGRNESGKRLIGIVIVAHGGLAREYLSAVEHVVGRQDGVRAISIEDDHDRSAKQAEICDAADAVDMGQGVVLVTDMFGGSPVEPVAARLCHLVAAGFCMARTCRC